MSRPPRETRSRQSIVESDLRSEYSSTSHHSSYDMSRQVLSVIDLTQEMAKIKEQLARSAAIRADARQREKEAEEETACSYLRLNNLDIALRNVQPDTERKLKWAHSHSECESEPAAEKQQREWRDKRHMPPPPNPLETTGQIDDAAHRQHHSRAEEPTGETRSLLQTIQEQIVSNIEADTASTGLELEAEHWQRKEAVAARRYTRALELRAVLAEEAMGKHQDGSYPDEERLCAVDEPRAARRAVESRHRVHNTGLTGDTRHVILPNEGPQRPVSQPHRLAQKRLGYTITQRVRLDNCVRDPWP
jgi:hypothetical protein